MPSAATQPEPSTPTPHAVPRILTTLALAARTCGSRAIALCGGGTAAAPGPEMRGNGSSEDSVLSSGPVGGSSALSWRRIVERCTSRRMSGPACSATAPSTHATSSPTHAVSAAPSAPSTAVNVCDRTRARRREPTPSKPAARMPPAISAPTSAKAGVHAESSGRISGATRVPSHAPAAKPTSASAPATKPCAHPNSASRTTAPTITQSIPVTERSSLVPAPRKDARFRLRDTGDRALPRTGTHAIAPGSRDLAA